MNAQFWSGRRVFLTGHTGFKGSWLSIWLQSLGSQVTGFALAPPDSGLFTLSRVGDQMHSVIGDIRDVDAVTRAVRDADPEIILHLAAQALVRASYREPIETYATNVMGTAHLLNAARSLGGLRSIVVVTSDKCYQNDGSARRAFVENDPLGGHDPYSSSKACAELVTTAFAASFFRDSAVTVASARAGNVIGGGDWAEDRLIPDLVRGWVNDTATTIRYPAATRPWQHVLEPLGGYLRLAEKLSSEGQRYAGPWNFGPSAADVQPVAAVADRMVALLGGTARWQTLAEPQPVEAQTLALDAGKACRELGWQPRWRLDEALHHTAAWYRKWKTGADPSAIRQQCLDDINAYLSA